MVSSSQAVVDFVAASLTPYRAVDVDANQASSAPETRNSLHPDPQTLDPCTIFQGPCASRPRLVPARPKVCTRHVRKPLRFPKQSVLKPGVSARLEKAISRETELFADNLVA